MRILSVDEGPIPSWVAKTKRALLLGVIVTEEGLVENIATTHITVDGTDGTTKVKHLTSAVGAGWDAMMLPSVCIAGFNIIDLEALHEDLRKPIIVANPSEPNLQKAKEALQKHIVDWGRRWNVLRNAGARTVMFLPPHKKLFLYVKGVSMERAKQIVRRTIVFGGRPEPLRIVKILAKQLG